jgi:hypothetical protein
MKRLISSLFVFGVASLCLPVMAQAEFGIQSFDVTFTNPDGSIANQAGSHPYAMTTSFHLITGEREGGGEPTLDQIEDATFEQIQGFVGSTTAVPQCSAAEFLNSLRGAAGEPLCKDATAVGLNTVEALGGYLLTNPVYNLEPPPGVVAELGTNVLTVPIIIEVGVKNSAGYNVIASLHNISQAIKVFSAKLTLWGVPADPAHDAERGHCYIYGGLCPSSAPLKPFLTLPRACQGPLVSNFEAVGWEDPGAAPDKSSSLTHDGAEPRSPQGMTGCGKLGFGPTIEAAPTTKAAQSPTGLDFGLNVNDEGLTNPTGLAQSDIRKAVVTLPEGFTTNPSLAEGLNVCTEADLERETVNSAPGAGCPNESKIGTVEVESPLLEESVDGSLYIAKPYENPEGSLIALYMVIKNPTLGIIIKQPLRVENNPITGQITTVAEELPQLPFSHFKLRFREGTRSPLASPPLCGTYNASAELTPWSGGAPITTMSAFSLISGPNAGPCPSGTSQPFHPGLEAGTVNNAAGSYSPFYLHLTRSDGEQEITHFSIKLPPGVSGKLAGIPFCSDAAIAAAAARTGPHGGQEEIEHPSCPGASEVGHTLVGAGVGPSLAYAPGKVYLAGPYHGSALSIVAITAAKVGPFDLGTVVVREALKVNPETAEVFIDATGSDSLPHIIKGIPVHLRDIRVYVDRPEFVINPTSCEPTSTASTVLGSGTDFASEADDRPVTVTTRFQAADCASLAFRPKVKLTLSGPTKRAGLPKLKAVVTPHPGDANIRRAVVTLPKSEFLEQGHIGTVCTRVQFNAGGGNGEQCPAKSIYGHAVATTPLLSEPLEGPVYLRSNGGERRLPDLLAALHSTDININLLGFIDSLHPKGSDVSQIRTTFGSVPDAPVTKFTLEMFGGKKGLLVNSTNLCKGTHQAISKFTGQNGKRSDTEPAVQAQCGKKKGKKKAKRDKTKAKSGNAPAALALLDLSGW